jgi:carbonic anhydrase
MAEDRNERATRDDAGSTRRGFLAGSAAAGAAVLGTAVVAACSSAQTGSGPAATAGTTPGGTNPSPELARPDTPEAVLRALKDGNARFAAGTSLHPNLGADLRARAAEGQQPFAAILACADSRVAPELIFDQGIGDLFVVRTAGNITDPVVAASLAYAVEVLGADQIFVLGHEACGAVQAAIDVDAGAELPAEFAVLTDAILPAVSAAKADGASADDLLAAATAENARLQAEQLTAQSDLLRQALAENRVGITSGVYELSSSKVELG